MALQLGGEDAMNTDKYRGWGILMLLFVSISFWWLFKGCSGGGGGGGGGSAPRTHMVLPLDEPLSFQVHSNQTSTFTYTYQLRTDMPVYDSFKIDPATVSHITVTAGLVQAPSLKDRLASLASIATDTAEVFFRIGSNSDTVCTAGNPYGPYSISLDTLAQIVGVTPEHVPPNPGTLEIINKGSIAMCMVVTSPIDATFSIDSAEVDVTESDCGTPANFGGTWSGEFTCGNSCGGPFGGPIELTVTQNGSAASYSDGSTTFSGKICGNVFRFETQDASSMERGTMTMNPDGSAEKRSTWRTTIEPICEGDCTDNLTRQ
jgi:hypothetical protein